MLISTMGLDIIILQQIYGLQVCILKNDYARADHCFRMFLIDALCGKYRKKKNVNSTTKH